MRSGGLRKYIGISLLRMLELDGLDYLLPRPRLGIRLNLSDRESYVLLGESESGS